MQDNPFASMLELIRNTVQEQNTPAYRLGEVISASPLKINVMGTPQDRDSIEKNESINAFSVGERVLLACLDGDQRFVVICKVVSV